jgi:hypothetical protein
MVPRGDRSWLAWKIAEIYWMIRVKWHVSSIRRTLFYFSAAERGYRWHLARARALKCAVYCVYHADDASKCANDPVHR